MATPPDHILMTTTNTMTTMMVIVMMRTMAIKIGSVWLPIGGLLHVRWIAGLPGQKVAPASRHNIVGRRIVILVTMMIIMMVKIVMMIFVSKSILKCFSSRNKD